MIGQRQAQELRADAGSSPAARFLPLPAELGSVQLRQRHYLLLDPSGHAVTAVSMRYRRVPSSPTAETSVKPSPLAHHRREEAAHRVRLPAGRCHDLGDGRAAIRPEPLHDLIALGLSDDGAEAGSAADTG